MESNQTFKRLLMSLAVRDKRLLDLTLELTPMCNLGCKMCYARMAPEHVRAAGGLLGAERWLEIAAEAKKAGTVYMLLTGGEPFSYPGFLDLYDRLTDMGFLITINTNGTLIDEKTADRLAAKAPAYLNITMYGASNGTYAALCGVPDGFDRFDRAVRLLRERGIVFQLNHSITPYNCHDLEACHTYASENGIHIRSTSYMYPATDRNTEYDTVHDRLTPEEAAYYMVAAGKLRNTPEKFRRMAEPQAKCYDAGYCEAVIPDEDLSECNTGVPAEPGHMRCHAGRSSAWIDWQGRMIPCGLLHGVGGYDLRQMTFDEAWQRSMAAVDAVRLDPECTGCKLEKLCTRCAAMSYCETGDTTKKPPYFCAMVHAMPGCYKRALEDMDK